MMNTASFDQSTALPKSYSKVCLVGLGITGQSCLRYLKGKSIDLLAMDAGPKIANLPALKADFPEVEFLTGRLDADKLNAADLIILSPGVPRQSKEIKQARQNGIPVVGDIELFAHESDPAKVISITGSNGKSTVASLCGELLATAGIKAQVGGNIGQPALDLLSQHADVYVLELSSFQLESTTSLNSSVAVILNITPDHLDRYPSYEAYINAKQRIFNNASQVVYNRADQHTYPTRFKVDKVISFGLDAPSTDEDFGLRTICGRQWVCQGDVRLVAVDLLKIKGKHNWLNAMAALALAYLVGADLTKAANGFAHFCGLEHRFEYIGSWGKVSWINDSKGTNPGATLASIQGHSSPIVLIIGGDAKGADFSSLRKAMLTHVKAVVLFGRDRALIEKVLPAGMPMALASTLDEAVNQAHNFTVANDMVVFSPACASFDMFNNYVERGRAFKSAVREFFA